MGYLIEPSNIFTETTFIPEATFQAMDSTNPVVIINTNQNFFCIPLACLIYIDSTQTTPYSGFSHLHITNNGSYNVPDLVGTLNENACAKGANINPALYFGFAYSMSINTQQANRFGGTAIPRIGEVFFDTLPTAGDGNAIIKLIYTKIPNF